ncbi:MAG TPA: 50S ribosomal protein L22 [Thermoleophilaceae bacterium]|nr:50S ribosomal protein L22 [Thermoleophilaceae bacterium]
MAEQVDTPKAPTNADGVVEVRASARFVRRAPRKVRLVMDHIRGKRVDEARAMLAHTPRAAAVDVAKLLDSAVANAENNFELDPDDLCILRATADEGPTIKRFRPRALGRATPIHKRTSHLTITLTTTAPVAGSADTEKAGK